MTMDESPMPEDEMMPIDCSPISVDERQKQMDELRILKEKWQRRDAFKLWEIICLWSGHEPCQDGQHECFSVDSDDALFEVKKHLDVSIAAGTLPHRIAPQYWDLDPLQYEKKLNADGAVATYDETFITRSDLKAWAESRGQRPDFLFDLPSSPKKSKVAGSYSTPKLDLLFATLEAFHEKGQFPTQPEMQDWHSKQYYDGGAEVPPSLTKAIFQILNPPDKHQGGAPKKYDTTD